MTITQSLKLRHRSGVDIWLFPVFAGKQEMRRFQPVPFQNMTSVNVSILMSKVDPRTERIKN